MDLRRVDGSTIAATVRANADRNVVEQARGRSERQCVRDRQRGRGNSAILRRHAHSTVTKVILFKVYTKC